MKVKNFLGCQLIILTRVNKTAVFFTENLILYSYKTFFVKA